MVLGAKTLGTRLGCLEQFFAQARLGFSWKLGQPGQGELTLRRQDREGRGTVSCLHVLRDMGI